MKRSTLRFLHRWLGLIFSLFVFAAASSGILHNVMSMRQKAPPPARPEGAIDVSLIKLTPTEAARSLPASAGDIQSITVRSIAHEPWYQYFVSSQAVPLYVHAGNGRLDARQDELYAAQIASLASLNGRVRKSDYLTAYNREYLNIFRILPVHRFDFDDATGTRVYVSTLTGSITRRTDNQSQWEVSTFSLLHKFMFIPHKEIRDWVLTGTTGAIALVALLGVLLFFKTGKHN
jgi:hypothetical protein